MQATGVDAAIRELQQEVKSIQEAIGILRKINAGRGAAVAPAKRGRRRLSAHARRRISEAAKKRWASVRAAKKEAAKSGKS